MCTYHAKLCTQPTLWPTYKALVNYGEGGYKMGKSHVGNVLYHPLEIG